MNLLGLSCAQGSVEIIIDPLLPAPAFGHDGLLRVNDGCADGQQREAQRKEHQHSSHGDPSFAAWSIRIIKNRFINIAVSDSRQQSAGEDGRR
jgi:hypothetical protein